MRDRRNHAKGLRAALQVARGNRQSVVAAAVVGLTPGCGGDALDAPITEDAGVTMVDGARAQDGAVDPVDALLADIEADVAKDDPEDVSLVPETSLEDDIQGAPEDVTGPVVPDSSDVSQTDDAPSPEDMMDASSPSDTEAEADVEAAEDMSAPPADADLGADVMPTEEDVSSSDTQVDCLPYCWQPIEQACDKPEDCDREDVEGACSTSGDGCLWDWQCPEGEVCEGAVKGGNAYVDEDGSVSPSSQLNCIDGLCHEGDMLNPAAMACCSGQWEQESCPLDPEWGWTGGCTPWGPPAPPEFDGEPLEARIKRLFA